MSAGWSWQIEHEHRIHRGYVYSPAFISDEDAERELRARNPKIGPTRIVKFVSGRYEHAWRSNVIAIGNASGFVEPLEATAFGNDCPAEPAIGRFTGRERSPTAHITSYDVQPVSPAGLGCDQALPCLALQIQHRPRHAILAALPGVDGTWPAARRSPTTTWKMVRVGSGDRRF
jgi:hypothetical protein